MEGDGEEKIVDINSRRKKGNISNIGVSEAVPMGRIFDKTGKEKFIQEFIAGKRKAKEELFDEDKVLGIDGIIEDFLDTQKDFDPNSTIGFFRDTFGAEEIIKDDYPLVSYANMRAVTETGASFGPQFTDTFLKYFDALSSRIRKK